MNRFLRLAAPAVLLVGLAWSACTPDRTFDAQPLPQPQPVPGTSLLPVINEFVCKGSRQTTEFGTASDWLELYNPNAEPYELKAGEWFVTDTAGAPTKYRLPARTLPPRGFLVIWCDSRDTVATQLHTSFNLSAGGGAVGLYRKPAGSTAPPAQVDLYHYPLQTVSGASLGRSTDGSPTWISFGTPTPGAPNR